MSKTPQQMALDHARLYELCEERCIAEESFLAGYEAGRPQWISVKDRLPELNQTVLVFGPFEPFQSINTIVFAPVWVEAGYMTHWMPTHEVSAAE